MTTLAVKGSYLLLPSLLDGVTYIFAHFTAITEYFQEDLISIGIIGVSEDTGATPYPLFTSGEQCVDYFSASQSAAILAQVNTDAGYTAFTTTDFEMVDPAVSQAIMNLSSVYVPQSRTINGHALSVNLTLTASDVGAIAGSGSVSGTNTGDQDLSGLALKTTTVNGHALSSNVTLATTDLADFNTATDGRITTKINALLNGADAAHDTFKELQDLMSADETTAAALATTVGSKVDKIVGKGLSTNDYTTTEQTKLAGIATGATANSSDATLLNRANHTGTQLAATISDFSTAANTALTTALAGKQNTITTGSTSQYFKGDLSLGTLPTVIVYSGTTIKSNPVFYANSTTVASGVAVFQLTTDGTSTGTAIFSNGPITSSLNAFVSDATASYQMSGAWSNSNKTLTITANKLTTANILTGILGQSSANGAVVNVQVHGN